MNLLASPAGVVVADILGCGSRIAKTSRRTSSLTHRIEGFEPEEGMRYTIEVERREVLNPPADASGFEYTLIRIIQETPVG